LGDGGQVPKNKKSKESVEREAQIADFLSPGKPAVETFWQKEVRLFKAEVASWGFNKPKATKVPAKKAEPKKVNPKKVQTQKAKAKMPASKLALRITYISLLTFAFLLLTLSASVYAYKNQFKTKALYGTKILGVDVGGKDLAEVRELVAQKTGVVTISFSVEGQNVVVKPVDAGVNFNPDGTAVAALRKGKTGEWYEPWLASGASLLYKVYPPAAEQVQPALKENMSAQYAIDSTKLTALTQNLSQSYNVQSQNAGLVMRGTEVQVIPAIYGRQILTDSIKTQIADAIKSAETVNITIQVEKINPAIVETQTQKSIDAAKVILNTPVSYHYQGKVFAPDKATVGSWIVFNTQKVNGKDQLVPAVDAKLVYPYVYNNIASKINIPAVAKKVTIKNGAEQVVEVEGKDGLSVNVDKVSLDSAANLTVARPVDVEIPTYVVKAGTKVNNITVADWAKYIDVNLSSQSMCAYLAGGDQQGCWNITSGATAKGYYTPTGTFLIQRKVFVTSMPNPPSPVPLTNIHYVSYFTAEGHAIHEAWWRSSFGGNPAWNGSHGCVNAPIGVAKWIYDWAPIGTPVIIHY
jgi:lipoprotein-anchoring transpeptidase ErfK/SrfK